MTQQYKRIEFKVQLDTQQRQLFEWHQQKLRAIWNIGLACLEWREWYQKWEQVLASPAVPGYRPEPIEMVWAHNTVKDKHGKPKKKPVYGLACERVRFRLEKGESRPSVAPGEWVDDPKRGSGKTIEGYWVAYPAKPYAVKEHWVEEPRLPAHGKNPYMSLVTMFGQKNWPEDHFIRGMASAWVKGQCKALADAWASYRSGVRKRPRYRKRYQVGDSLLCPQRLNLKPSGISLPKMGLIRLKGLHDRVKPEWGNPCPVSLIQEGSDFYVQLTFPVETRKVRHNGVVVGLDPGSVRVITDDQGRAIEPPRFGKKMERRIRRLQAALNRKRRLNSEKVYYSEDNPNKFYLRPIPEWTHKNHDRQKLELQRLHAKVKRQRRAFNHFHSTRIVEAADVIILENLALPNVTAKVRKGKAGEQNGRKRKAGLNRNLLDNATGQLFSMIEQKAAAVGKPTTRVNPFRTSVTCNRCGFSDKANRPSQASFCCQQCGHRDNADRNAAANIKQMGILGVTKLTFDDRWQITVPGWGTMGGD